MKEKEEKDGKRGNLNEKGKERKGIKGGHK